ncbi:glycosyltransferase [Streptosporangium sp. NPDC000509]|uniref:glycosyltransferase n=1 Tax=Streptosporangium sp. NPDC000509 TaxID=3366186 RepID=UPI00368A63E0
MKILFIAGPTKSSVFGLAPLATAARARGHHIILASSPEAVSASVGIGVPAFSMTPLTLTQLMTLDRAGKDLRVPQNEAEIPLFVGGMFGRLTAAGFDRLHDLMTEWRPDLVVGGPHSYAAPMLAGPLGLPCVRHLLTGNTADREGVHPGVEEELRPELDKLGLEHIPAFDLTVDILPASLRPEGTGPVQPLRWTPMNEQRPLEPWMFSRGERHRVVITAGSLATTNHSLTFLLGLVDAFTALDVEVIVATPDEVAEGLRGERGIAHAGWFPLDAALRTCDLIVHHSGAMTALAALNAGVPQLIIPQESRSVGWAQMLAAAHTAITLPPGEDSPDVLATAGRELLDNPLYARGAGEISREITEMPSPTDVVGVLEKLVGA